MFVLLLVFQIISVESDHHLFHCCSAGSSQSHELELQCVLSRAFASCTNLVTMASYMMVETRLEKTESPT